MGGAESLGFEAPGGGNRFCAIAACKWTSERETTVFSDYFVGFLNDALLIIGWEDEASLVIVLASDYALPAANKALTPELAMAQSSSYRIKCR